MLAWWLFVFTAIMSRYGWQSWISSHPKDKVIRPVRISLLARASLIGAHSPLPKTIPTPALTEFSARITGLCQHINHIMALKGA